ncbi:MAG TPA: GDSL-type esterase/lipase family protein, partial [Armatimonadota bacterium]
AVMQANYPELNLPPFINAGIGGHKAEDMAPRFATDMRLADKPAWTFINVGINDVWHRLGAQEDPAVLTAYTENVAKMVGQAQAAGANVVLLTPTLIMEDATSAGNTRLVKFVNAMQQIAAEKACRLVDLHETFLTAIAHQSALPLTCDGVHMAIYGDALMAIGVLRTLGVPAATLAKMDTLPLIQFRAFGMPLTQAADLLEIPPTRFAKPEFLRALFF